MTSILAGLLYLLAILLPIYLLYHFRPLAWPLHILAVLAAAAVGLAPGTALLNSAAGTYLYGCTFTFLAVWGLGGLLAFRWRKPKQAAAATGR